MWFYRYSNTTSNITQLDAVQFTLHAISTETVRWELEHLTDRKTTNDKHIIPMLRVTADLISESIATIFNRSIATSSFPTEWKTATVTPVFKGKGDASDPNTYRPISILSVIPRILEKHISFDLKSFLHDHKLIVPQQFAYMPHRSTTDQLVLLTEQLATIIDARKKYECVFLDFRKAFDRVNHIYLLSCIESMADEVTHKWFQSYLDSRAIQVKVDSGISTFRNLTSGVPQGSHLAPLLFNIYINSLPNAVKHCRMFLFADDVVLLHEHADRSVPENLNDLQTDINRCQQWARNVGGEFSPSKTKILTNYCVPSTICMDQQALPISTTTKHLGVILTADLKFSEHYNAIKKNFTQRVNLLCYMGKVLPPETILLLYKSYVRPAIEYAIPIWYHKLTKAQLAVFDILQARVCRRFLRSKNIQFDLHETKDNLNRLCNLQSLQFRRQLLSLIALFKINCWR